MVSVSVDVGGTFTDFVLERQGNLVSFKLPSTPSRPEEAILDGLAKIDQPVESILHATTLATNALLGQEGLEIPTVALLMTKEFRDVVEIARQNRSSLYDLFFEKPRELVPRNMRYELDERG